MKIPEALKGIVGKTVAGVEAYSDPSLAIKFTDGTSLSILNMMRPEFELMLFRTGNDEAPITSRIRAGG